MSNENGEAYPPASSPDGPPAPATPPAYAAPSQAPVPPPGYVIPPAPSYPTQAPSYAAPPTPSAPAYQAPAAQPVYAPPQNYALYGPAAPQKTNVMAILSLVFAFVFSPLGIVFGHIGLNQIKRTGEDGRGLALAGLIIGYIAVGALIAIFVIYFIIIVIILGAVGSSYPYGS